MKDRKIEIGKRIKELRKEKNITMDNFCADVNKKYGTNFNKSIVCRWENGTHIPDINSFVVLAEYYDIDVNFLNCLTDKKIKLSYLRNLDKNDIIKEIVSNLENLEVSDLQKIKKLINYFSEKGFDKIDKFLDLIS